MTPAETAADTIARHQMLLPGDRVLAAFSGGADSTALVLVLQQLGYDVVLGHVDHGMRPGSSGDARHCKSVARRLGLPFLQASVTVDPPTQSEARRVRYQALQTMADGCGATRIATGHTMDDQAETVMLRLGRGGYGLGIPPVRDNIIRPILELRRRDTEQVCRLARLDFCMDPSNRNLKYRRVAVRADLASSPGGEIARLAALARTTRAESDAVLAEVNRLWPSLAGTIPDGVCLVRAALAQASAAVRTQLIRRAAGELGLELSSRVVRDIIGKVVPVTGARLALRGNLWVWSERDRLVFGRFELPRALPQVTVRVPGTTALPGWDTQITVERGGPLTAWSTDRSTELVDASLLGAGLAVRQWKPGDRFRPLGAPGTRKVQDFFVDAGVPRTLRHTVPLVVSGDNIVWVGGHRVDDRFKVNAETTQVLRLTLTTAAKEDVA
ncbi:MAG TPA: tRNA lysidine(34) synthetase TilS [Actinomycetota bacterium]|nr:tRNA lysidine(34) synthetase TilS [Actinomycetota bacterium]